MDNLIEQLRDHAKHFGNEVSPTRALLTQAADTLAAQSRLLALAETLAGASDDLRMGWPEAFDPSQVTRLAEAAKAFTAAQAEYQATGKVPCPECEAKQQELEEQSAKAHNACERLIAYSKEREGLITERDELRRQLETAQELNREVIGSNCAAKDQLDRLTADNAALTAWLRDAVKCVKYCGVFEQNISGRNDAPFAREIERILSQPHPGAGLLEEREALLNALAAISDQHLKSTEAAEFWSAGDIATRALDAIRNRKGR